MSSNLTNNPATDQASQSAPTDQLAPADQSEPMDVEAARRIEDGKLTRRAALRKLGFGAGVAAFSLLGVDDLARLVGQRLARHSYRIVRRRLNNPFLQGLHYDHR